MAMLNFARSVWVLISLAPASLAQWAWQQVATAGPVGREMAGMAYDQQRGRTVLFGGNNAGLLNDTWEWDGMNWLPQFFGAPPSPRAGHTMAYHSHRGRVVLFGGTNSSGVVLGDLWEWNGSTWTQIAASGPARSNHGMVYDTARNRLVAFGGSNGVYLGDTQEWDGASWAQVATTGPSARNTFAMAYDEVRGRTLLFGGSNGSGKHADTWEWDGMSWIQKFAPGPSARTHQGMVFFRQRGAIVLLGGSGAIGGCLSDGWEWNGTTWTQLPSGGPGPRAHPHMAYDTQRRRAVVWGGSNCVAYTADTWELSVPNATAFGTGCGAPPLTLGPVTSSPPLINSTGQATLTNVPSSFSFVALGVSNTHFGAFPLPVTLVSVGMPGCFLLHSAEVTGELAPSTGFGNALYGFTIPNNIMLIGLHVYLQAWAWAPGANPANIIVSNGLDWQIGY